MGKSGLQLSELSFGSWITFGNQIDKSISGRLMDIAYDAGVNFFDNAEVYAHGASEEVMGEILAQKSGRDTWCMSASLWRGRQTPYATGLHRKHRGGM